MFWIGAMFGAVICGVITFIALLVMAWRERNERAAYLATLSEKDRAKLIQFEAVNRDWKLFRSH